MKTNENLLLLRLPLLQGNSATGTTGIASHAPQEGGVGQNHRQSPTARDNHKEPQVPPPLRYDHRGGGAVPPLYPPRSVGRTALVGRTVGT